MVWGRGGWTTEAKDVEEEYQDVEEKAAKKQVVDE